MEILCKDEFLPEVLGDLNEQYRDNVVRYGKWKSNVLYWINAFGFLRPGFAKRWKRKNPNYMVNNYLKTSYRNLIRSKIYAVINLFGLAAGIGSFLFIALYLHNELTYDSFFPDSNRIYRIALERIYPDRVRNFASSPVTLAPILKDNYPEVENVTRMHRLFFRNDVPVKVGEESFKETNYYFADENFFKVFPYKFLKGNPDDALSKPENVVLTHSTAIKYFGTLDVLGKTISDGIDQIVTGVIEDLPENTHIHFDLLGSIYSLSYLNDAINNNSWVNPWIYTYVKLRPGTNPESFQKKLGTLVEKYGKASISAQIGSNYAEEGHKFNYFLQPIQDIHLHSNLDIEVEPNSNIQYVYLLSAIALVILLISSINFINLSTARSSERAKEVGVRKVMGSFRSNLVAQFITESILISFVSSLIALCAVYYLLPVFNSLLEKNLSMNFFLDPVVIFLFVIFILVLGFISGLYPALVISSLQPSGVLKGSFKTSKKGTWLRNFLIIIQFAASIVMISGSIIVKQQMLFMKNKDLGFDKDNVIVLKDIQPIRENAQGFMNEVRLLHNVVSAGSAQAVPGDFLGSNIYSFEDPGVSDLRANTLSVDDNFFETMQFEVVDGRGFDPAYDDSLSVILNEAAVRDLGLTDPVGKRIKSLSAANSEENPWFTIIGVVKDFNFQSLHNSITPLVVSNFREDASGPVIAIRINDENFQSTIDAIKNSWTKISSTSDFEFSFLNQDLDRQYRSDKASGKLFDIFTYIAIIMCCTGLYGLATYMVQQKTKEMGIRKVHGASFLDIITSFSKGFVKLIFIAFVLGVPLAYYLMDAWLSNFAYHVNVNFLTFFLTAVFSILLVLITVSYQSIKVARLNPIKSIRTE